ncbi:uncharacterized protein LOC123713085 isoform X1 [Pieris brassicae]|uniref:Uncharacterized protein n=1 Tax=Pieris brassicae TaxID=7116 RepID=A0A9P0TRP7_PIEBR|nr:uncharacterized protein LOC123713085 isoform X1 [Pieris brassicae]CAH4033811.1 unnamed protein product [Pieris brassicae]
MASSDPEIHDGFTLPVWMKTKPAKEFEPFSTSPPAPEDSFFYIRYPKTDALFGKPKLNGDLPKIIQEQQKDVSVSFNNIKEKDWSKHTKPCQDVLHGIAPINTAANPLNLKPKPAGTDDGFKGEGAACGTSVLKVANQMISTRGPRGFTVASPSDDGQDTSGYNLMARRGSKSLPTTPMHSPPSSPNSRRKMYNNRYFTSPYEPVEDVHGRSWLTMALLGFKKDLTTSSSTLAEEEIVENRLQTITLAESVENLGPSPKIKEPKIISETSNPSKSPKSSPAFRAKPSELREMNFWSPTSM